MISRPVMDEQTLEYVKELYKAHFTPKEVANMVPFGYGCLIARWNMFKFAGIEKYDRMELINANSKQSRAN